MKKQILTSVLMILLGMILVVSVVSCTGDGQTNQNSGANTAESATVTNETPTEEPTEAPTEEVTAYPEDGPDWSLNY